MLHAFIDLSRVLARKLPMRLQASGLHLFVIRSLLCFAFTSPLFLRPSLWEGKVWS